MTAAEAGPAKRLRFRALPAPARWTTYIAALVIVAMVVGIGVGTIVVRRSWPQVTGEIKLPGLDAKVEVIRDVAGIPQIYADTTHDLMLAQGFVHAQERFFEMDVRRHATAGRLSELFGEAGVETDVVVRTLGWRRIAEKELELLQPSTRNALDAYAKGVNAYLADREPSEISLEYTLLGLTGLDYRPADWSAVDSIAWLKAMAWDLRGNLDDEISRAMTTAAVGPVRSKQLFPQYPYDKHAPIVTGGGVVGGDFRQDAARSAPPKSRRVAGRQDDKRVAAALRRTGSAIDALPAMLGRGDGIGSNAWVVSGERTESGSPILANDPHLGVSLPGIWTQVGLHCNEISSECPIDVSGFSFSGVPGVVIGHNSDISWGFTNLGPDVTDLFVERIVGDRWQHGGRRKKLETRIEQIKVNGAETINLPVRSTEHGPIISDLEGRTVLGDQAGAIAADRDHDTGEGGWDYGVALAWTALEPRPTADAIFELNQARDWKSFRSALADFSVPGQNIVYADTEGHIGYQATGQVPIRGRGNSGLVPAAGWRPANDWTGRYVPYDAMPRLYDPESGDVVTANQAAVDQFYPYDLGQDWDRGYRSDRISQLLEDRDDLTVEDMVQVQTDEHHPMADVLTPHLQRQWMRPGYESGGQRLLQDWDGQGSADSAAAAYFNAVWRELLARTFHDELPKEEWPDGGQRWFAAVTQLLSKRTDKWWDDVETDQYETRDEILRAAMLGARDELTKRQSPNPEEWTWGGLHMLELRSSTLGESGIGVVERLFNRGGWGIGGGSSIVNATGWDAREGFEVTTSPSMRMVVPMDDLDAARWINLTGVSGHAFHPNYTDQTDLFVKGDTLPWAFTRKEVTESAKDELTLLPD